MVDAINPVIFMVYLYVCVCVIFTSFRIRGDVFVSCVGRRGVDDSDANVSEGSPYILPSRSSTKAKMSMRHPVRRRWEMGDQTPC